MWQRFLGSGLALFISPKNFLLIALAVAIGMLVLMRGMIEKASKVEIHPHEVQHDLSHPCKPRDGPCNIFYSSNTIFIFSRKSRQR